MKLRLPFLHNVRRGLATNSSSSHSLVFHAEPASDEDVSSAAYADTEFGWDHFVLRSLGEKLMYGLTQAIGNGWRSGKVSPEEVAAAREKFGHLFPEITDDALWVNAMNGYVDHQSQEFSEELVTKLRDPHVVVHGGNDNGGYPEFDWNREEGKEIDLDLPEGARREMLG